MTFVMNEEEYAEKLLSGEAVVGIKNRSYAVAVIAKYYKALGDDDKTVADRVGAFISERSPGGSAEGVKITIKRALSAAKKYPLYRIGSITVTDREIEIISSLFSDKFKPEKLRRLAFAFLCFSKYEAAKGRKDGWVNIERKHIFQAADLKNIKTEKQLLYIHELCKLGYVDIGLRIGSGGIKVLGYADGEKEVEVDDINEVGYIFEEYEGRRFVKCQRCGRRVPVTNGRTVYCRECAVIVDREKARERMKKALFV